MRRVSIGAATVGAWLAATAAFAQAQITPVTPAAPITPGVTAPATTGAGTTGAGPAATSGAQQPAALSGVITTIRRAGMGPGGFLQLCDDPLDPRAITNECSAAGIAQ